MSRDPVEFRLTTTVDPDYLRAGLTHTFEWRPRYTLPLQLAKREKRGGGWTKHRLAYATKEEARAYAVQQGYVEVP